MNFRRSLCLAVSLIALAVMASAASTHEADHSVHHGMTGCPMMGGGMMGGGMMDRMGRGMMGMGPGTMGGTAPGMARLFGSRVTPILNLSVEDVRGHLTGQLERLNNKRLKIGDVKADTGTITADVVTVDNSLVQRLRVDRHTGAIDYQD